jgi:c-di-GMP-binding flagellar brake protein YcgR
LLISAGQVEQRKTAKKLMSQKMSTKAARALQNKDDRRSYKRLDIKQDVHYKVLGPKNSVKHAGFGKTIDMSSGGVLISTQSIIVEGEKVEMSIAWPAQLDGVLPLKLVATGRVVRSDEKQAAITIESHEFKTRGSSGL